MTVSGKGRQRETCAPAAECRFPGPAAIGLSREASIFRRKQACSAISRRSPLQGPHCFDRVSSRIAHAAGNRLVVKALHVLLRRNAESRGFAAKQGEFASRDVGADLLDDTVMIDQGFGYPAVQRWLR